MSTFKFNFTSLLFLASASLALAAPPIKRANAFGFSCPKVDDLGVRLFSELPARDAGFTSCVYGNSTCTYFDANGTFSSGSSTCPDGLLKDVTPGGGNAGNNGGAPPPPPAQAFACPAVDDLKSGLISTAPNGNFIGCTYSSAGFCQYFSNGSFSSGSSACPDSLTAASPGATAAPVRTTAAAQPTAPVQSAALVCPSVDDNNTRLTTSVVNAGKVGCTYPAARFCEYFTNGNFSSGSSTCPDALVKAGARLSGAVESEGDSKSGDYSTLIRNSYIAIGLLAAVLIGLIVLVLLILAKAGLKGKAGPSKSKTAKGDSGAYGEVESLRYADRDV